MYVASGKPSITKRPSESVSADAHVRPLALTATTCAPLTTFPFDLRSTVPRIRPHAELGYASRSPVTSSRERLRCKRELGSTYGNIVAPAHPLWSSPSRCPSSCVPTSCTSKRPGSPLVVNAKPLPLNRTSASSIAPSEKNHTGVSATVCELPGK